MASTATVSIILKMIDKASGTMNKVSKSAEGLSKNLNNAGNSMKSFGQRSMDMGKSLTRNVTLPIVAIGGAMVKTYADFDATLTNIEARTGATSREMEKIRKVAIDMGRDTAFSANAAADAMLELMSSGSSVEEAISTLPHVLNLASAGQLELGRSSDIVTDILAQFQLEVDKSESVVNALAAAAQSSSADVESLSQGFANGGVVAKMFGMNIHETAATLAVFAEAGIKGADAGTQLKSMLTAMSSQTQRTQSAWKSLGLSMFFADGSVKSLNFIISELNGAMSGLTAQERILMTQDLAGSFGQKGLAALLAADGYSNMSDTMFAAQTAEQVAQKQMESFNGAVNQLSGSMQTLSIVVIGPFVEKVLKPMVVGITKVLNIFTDWAAKNEALATGIVAILAALALIGPALLIIGMGASLFGTMATGLSVLTGAFAALSAGMSFVIGLAPAMAAAWVAITGPIGLAIAAIVALIAIGALVIANWDEIMAVGERFGQGLAVVGERLSGLGSQFATIVKEGLSQLGQLLPRIHQMLLDGAVAVVRGAAQLGADLVMGIANGIVDTARAAIQAISDVGNGMINAAKSVFGISSPSKVMAEMGGNVGLGFIRGVNDSFKTGIKAITPNIEGQAKIAVSSFGSGLSTAAASPTGGLSGASSLMPLASGAGGGWSGDIIIENLNVPAGTPKEAVDFIWKEIANRMARRGVS